MQEIEKFTCLVLKVLHNQPDKKSTIPMFAVSQSKISITLLPKSTYVTTFDCVFQFLATEETFNLFLANHQELKYSIEVQIKEGKGRTIKLEVTNETNAGTNRTIDYSQALSVIKKKNESIMKAGKIFYSLIKNMSTLK
jgi:hypothetical protein